MIDIPEQLIAEITAQNPDGVVLIAVDGCGGAGKSTVATKLAQKLGDSQVVHIDDFYKSKEDRIEITKDIPVHSNFEFDRLKQQVLEPLRHGDNANRQTANRYVIVEGLGTLGIELRDYFDYKVWIDSPEAVRRQRGIKRDSEAWTKIWDEEYLPQDVRYMREQTPQDKADWVLSNN